MPAALCLTHAPFLRRPVEPRTTRLGAYSILLTAPWVLGSSAPTRSAIRSTAKRLRSTPSNPPAPGARPA